MKRATVFFGPIVQVLAKPYVYAAVFSLVMTGVFVFTLLDAFVIPKPLRAIPTVTASEASPAPSESEVGRFSGMPPRGRARRGRSFAPPSGLSSAQTDQTQPSQSYPEAASDQAGASGPANQGAQERSSAQRQMPEITETSYKDEHITITVETIRAYDTDVHIADITVSDAGYLKTAFAKNTYGRNIKDETSAIAADHNAILAVNGDYYGFRENGWVLRNGVLYRSGGDEKAAAADAAVGTDALLMDMDGNLFCEDAAALSVDADYESHLWQIWTFGPPLVLDGDISVSIDEEISGRSARSNPRTAIGETDNLRYVFIVSDGRTESNAGLSLYELAQLFKERGCEVAYNLDGGGSSTMYFNGRVVNYPTTDGRKTGERGVSDIVYIGY